MRKSVQQIQRYLMKYASFLATSYLTFTNEPCQLWSYWIEFCKIFTQYADINSAINAPIDVAISHTVSECQSDENGELCHFCTKSVAMATSLVISKKEVQIDRLKMLSFDVKFAKIGPADLQIICLREIIKKDKKR